MEFEKLIKRLNLSQDGLEYLCIEYKDEKGNLVSSHTELSFENTGNDVFLILSPDKNNQVVIPFEKEVKLVEDNVVIFDDNTALVFYKCREVNMERFC